MERYKEHFLDYGNIRNPIQWTKPTISPWKMIAQLRGFSLRPGEGVSYRDFVLAGLWCIEQNQRFSSSLILYKCFLDWVHDGGIRTCGGWAIQVQKWSDIKKSSTSWNFRTVKTPMQVTQHGSSLIENLSKSGVFSMPTPTEEIKPVIWVSFHFGFGGEKKINVFLGRFWLSGYWC